MIIQYDLNQCGTIKIHGTVICICDKCGKEFHRIMGTYIKHYENPDINEGLCDSCHTSNRNINEEQIKKFIKGKKKYYQTPEGIICRKNASKRMKENNPMFNKETRKKVSETRKELLKNPEMRNQISLTSKKAWEDGKFEGVNVGKCRWYDYLHSNGNIYKVQGTWELAFIEWLDKYDISFICHRGRIPYVLDGVERNYYPDFYINDWNCYVDVKCRHFYKEEKFKAILKSNPDIKLKILFKDDLIKLGVEFNENYKYK